MQSRLIAALVVLVACAGPLTAQPRSVYTDTNLKRCKTVETFEEGGGSRLQCPGYGGISVTVVESDLRMYVGYGPNAQKQCAMHQTFGPFNNLGPKIEWRIDNGKPYATILRWVLDNGDGTTRSWLVVTKLDGAESCHVAYVEGSVPNANRRARDAADHLVRGFNCATDTPQVIARSAGRVTDFYTGVCEKN